MAIHLYSDRHLGGCSNLVDSLKRVALPRSNDSFVSSCLRVSLFLTTI